MIEKNYAERVLDGWTIENYWYHILRKLQLKMQLRVHVEYAVADVACSITRSGGQGWTGRAS